MSERSDSHFDRAAGWICQWFRLSRLADKYPSFMAFMMVPRETRAWLAACWGVSIGSDMSVTMSVGLSLLAVRLATFDHVQPITLDGLRVVVDVAPEGALGRHGDDLGPAALYPADGANLF